MCIIQVLPVFWIFSPHIDDLSLGVLLYTTHARDRQSGTKIPKILRSNLIENLQASKKSEKLLVVLCQLVERLRRLGYTCRVTGSA